jgi:phosphatidate cytidylyltransferase
VPRNPFADPSFLPTLAVVAVLLAVGVTAVLLAERKPLRVLRRSTLFVRLRTWLWIAPLFVVCLFAGGFVLFVPAVFVTLQAVSEYVRLVGLGRRYALLVMIWSLVGLIVGAVARDFFVLLPFGFFIVLTLIPVASGQVEGAARQVAAALFGYVYIGLPIAFVAWVVTGEPWGTEFLLLVAAGVGLSDVAGFAAGSALHTPRLLGGVAGGKTWSATAGNLLGAAAGVASLALVLPAGWSLAEVIALAVATGLGSVWGDLTGALMKRDFAVKDTGSLLFGFGGLLERVDSLLFAAPIGYFALLIVERLTS